MALALGVPSLGVMAGVAYLVSIGRQYPDEAMIANDPTGFTERLYSMPYMANRIRLAWRMRPKLILRVLRNRRNELTRRRWQGAQGPLTAPPKYRKRKWGEIMQGGWGQSVNEPYFQMDRYGSNVPDQ